MSKHTFVLSQNLGWAHYNGLVVMVTLITLRDHNMLMGAREIWGKVDDQFDGIEWYHRVPQPLKLAVNQALKTNDEREDRIREEEEIAPTRLSYLPVSLHLAGDKSYGNVLYIIAFDGSDAVDGAYQAGVQVRKDFGYSGPGGEPETGFLGMHWKGLRCYQVRNEAR